jgi:hypothetical protein
VEKEVKTIKTKIYVRTIELEVGTKPLVVVQVEIMKIIVKELNV